MSFVLMCFLFIAIRIIETVGRLVINWISKKFASTNPKSEPTYKRLVAIVSPELHARLKAYVMLANTTITEFILSAVTEKLARESNG